MAETNVVVLDAERRFYEACYLQWLGNGALLNFGAAVFTGGIASWARERAMRDLDEWRKIFVPECVGKPPVLSLRTE